jgi:peptidoglycan/LPS O-acetylase OafA/YrhL
MPPTASRENNFDAIRLIAAAAVIYGHAHPLTRTVDVGFLGNSVQSFAVKVFFVVSGFLITGSWVSDPSAARYLARRLLRIMPALVLVVLMSILLLGPVVTHISLVEYFRSGATWAYLSNIRLQPIYALPGVFNTLPYPSAVNGALWSLPVEFAMYLVLPVLVVAGRLLRARWFLAAATVALCLVSLLLLRDGLPRPAAVIYGTSMASFLDVSPYFLLGACFQQYPLTGLLTPAIALGLVGVVLFLQPSGPIPMELTLYLVAPLAILAFGLAPAPVFSRAGRWGDFSYGLYLYGFPSQQLVNELLGGTPSALRNALLSFPLALLCAVLSWHLVERRALRLKPRSGTRHLVASEQHS